MILTDVELNRLREALEAQANMDEELLQRCYEVSPRKLPPTAHVLLNQVSRLRERHARRRLGRGDDPGPGRRGRAAAPANSALG